MYVKEVKVKGAHSSRKPLLSRLQAHELDIRVHTPDQRFNNQYELLRPFDGSYAQLTVSKGGGWDVKGGRRMDGD